MTGDVIIQTLKEKRKKILANRVYSDETLKRWKKEDLIKQIRILEHNWSCAEESLNIQAKNCEMLLKQTVTDTAKEICDDLRNIFIEQSSYGSDANQHIGYYDYEVKMGLVIEQIEEYAKEKYGIEYGVEVE